MTIEGFSENSTFFPCSAGIEGETVKMGFYDNVTGTSVLIEAFGPVLLFPNEDYPVSDRHIDPKITH